MRNAVALALIVTAAAWACDPKGKQTPPRKVRISVVVILASEKDATIDKKLKDIAREVQKTYPELKGFRLAKMACKSLEVGKADTFELVDNQKANITIQQAADSMDRIRLKVDPPAMGEVTYSTPCGKFLPILTPIQTKKGERLLIAIRVQPCSGK